MSHISIAVFIIQDQVDDHSNNNQKFLVLEMDSNYQFMEFKDNAINAGFRRDIFKNELYKFLNLNSEAQCEFDPLGNRPYINHDFVSRTAYQVKLIDNSGKLNDRINLHLLQKKIKFNWYSYEDLMSLEDEWIKYQKFILEDSKSGIISKKPLPFENDFLSMIEKIQDAQKEDRLVVLVGAGVSVNSGIPSWAEVINSIRHETEIPENENEFPIVAQLLYNRRGESEYYNFLDKIFRNKQSKPNEIHKELLKLNPYHIITTNFDGLIEQADIEHYSQFGLVNKDIDFPRTLASRLIIKMHGDIEERNIVFREDDYLNYESNFPLIEKFIQGIFASKLVLIIGFSFTDPNLKIILERVRAILKNAALRPILFLPNSQEIQSMDSYYNSRGVDVIHFNKLINKYFIQNSLIQQEMMSELGNKLLNFLYFLREYDRNTETIRNSDIIEQMHNARLRFIQYKVTPPSAIIRVRPFAISKAKGDLGYYGSNDLHLKTRNERIIELLKKLRCDNYKILFTDNVKLSTDEKSKLTEVFEWLTTSVVNCIQLKDSFAKDNHHSISEFRAKEICECIVCTFFRFEIIKSLRYLNTVSKTETSEIKECWKNMGIAFVNAICGNYIEAYEKWQKVAVTSKLNGNLILYVLALYNIKLLSPYLESFWEPNDPKNQIKTKLLDDIYEIDLNRIISSLPLDKIDRDTLIKIVQNKESSRVDWQIDKYHKELLKIEKIYKNGGYSIAGPNYIKYILGEINEFYNINFGNHLLNLFGGEFSGIVEKVFRSAIKAHTISNNYNSKLENFSWQLCKLGIMFIDSDKFYEVIMDFQPDILKFNTSDKNEFIEQFNNLLESTWEDDLCGNIKKPIEYELQMDRSFLFDQRIRWWVSNSFILLGYTDINLTENEKTRIINNLINYLKLGYLKFEQKQIVNFILNRLNWFSVKQLDRLLPIIISKKWKYELDVINLTAKIRSVFNDFKIEKLWDSITLDVEGDLKYKAETVIDLFPICSDNVKAELRRWVSKYFLKFDWSDEMCENFLISVKNKMFLITNNKLMSKFYSYFEENINDETYLNEGSVTWKLIDVIHSNKNNWAKALKTIIINERTPFF